MAVNSQSSLVRLQQRLHREELALARLKTKDDKVRQADARLKRRLGRLLFLIDWQDRKFEDVETHLRNIPTLLARKSDVAGYRIQGEIFLGNTTHEREIGDSEPSTEAWRERNHRMITIGGLMMKHDLHEIDRSTLMGVLLEQQGAEKP